MPPIDRPIVVDPRARAFDVLCAGEAFLDVGARDANAARATARTAQSFGLRPGGGAINAALALAHEDFRVGLATVLSDDTQGRALLARVAATGVDVGGVELARPTSGLVFVRGGARQTLSAGDEDPPLSVPVNWSAKVLLLSGMSPVVSHAAALCKAARAARRHGTTVVMDVNARWDLWKGRDSRSVRMVLREADVVWCSAHDLFGLNIDVPSLRATLRPNAVLVLSDGVRSASATGPFGEVSCVLERRGAAAALAESRARLCAGAMQHTHLDEGDAFATAICAELARAREDVANAGALWARALRRAQRGRGAA